MFQLRKKRLLVPLLCLMVFSGFDARNAGAADKLRVLIFSGRNNHNWKATTPALKKIYRESGRFEVDVTNEPSSCDAETFAKYDVIVSNWAGFPHMNERQWGTETEKAFLDFVRSGKGFALFHAASASFHTWPEFQQLIGSTWGAKTGHGPMHKFKVVITDESHPVTRGMKDFFSIDELWHRTQKHSDAHILCSGVSARDKGGTGNLEAVALTTSMGKGRGFNLVLGHDVRAMQTPGWKTLMLRGTEWAATGEVTIPVPANWPTTKAALEAMEADVDALLKATSDYKFGGSRKPLIAVKKLVAASTDLPRMQRELAAKMAGMLDGDVTTACKQFLCEQLSLIATAEEVPAIAALLSDDELSHAARFALERIPGDEAAGAMREALKGASGEMRIGLVNTLGARRDAEAVPQIAKLISSKDMKLARSAIIALGKTGGMAAVKALTEAEDKVSEELRIDRSQALLSCADGLVEQGDTDAAAAIYNELSTGDQPQHIRVAAFPGLVTCRKDKAGELLYDALTGGDRALQAAAIRCAKSIGGTKLTKSLARQLPELDAAMQVQLINALARRDDPAAVSAVASVIESDEPAVKLAAIGALGALGNADTVGPLARIAAEGGRSESAIARRSLVRLKGKGIDTAIIELLGKAEPSVSCEMIVALEARGARAAVPELLDAAEADDRRVRREAIKALANLAEWQACPELLKIMERAESSDRRLIENALVSISSRTGKAEQTVEAVVKSMKDGKAGHLSSLLRVLGKLGGQKALKAVRSAVKNKDSDVRLAAIRAMAQWKDASPLRDLLAVARSSDETEPKALALRGFAQLSSKAEDVPAGKMAGLFAKALELAERSADKKALLGALGNVEDVAAMTLAAGLAEDADLSREACLATVQIAEKIWRYHQDEAKTAMKTVRNKTKSQRVKDRAAAVLLGLSKPVNLAAGAKATSPDGLEKDGAASGDQAAIDGDPETYWDEANGKKLYRLVVTLKQSSRVSAVSITGYQHHSFAPKDFDILCDGKVVKTVRGAKYENNKLSVVFPPTKCKSLELKITGYYGRSPAVRELEIYNLKQNE